MSVFIRRCYYRHAINQLQFCCALRVAHNTKRGKHSTATKSNIAKKRKGSSSARGISIDSDESESDTAYRQDSLEQKDENTVLTGLMDESISSFHSVAKLSHAVLDRNGHFDRLDPDSVFDRSHLAPESLVDFLQWNCIGAHVMRFV
jgi:hypothetical protein